MKHLIPIIVATCLLSVAAFTGCVKDTLYNTPHPDKGTVAVTADWNGMGDGVEIPDSWTVSIGDYTGTETGMTHTPDMLFDPGDYLLTAYGHADGITVDGTIASVAVSSGDGSGNFISGSPGWLLAGVRSVAVEADMENEFTVEMLRAMRELTLTVTLSGDAAGRVESMSGVLDGAAGTMDLYDGSYGTASCVRMDFDRSTDNSEKWSATVRLLGIAGERQTLSGTISFAGGNPRAVTFENDLTESLSGFNDDKSSPFFLEGTAETADEMDISSVIIGWDISEGPIEGDATMPES